MSSTRNRHYDRPTGIPGDQNAYRKRDVRAGPQRDGASRRIIVPGRTRISAGPPAWHCGRTARAAVKEILWAAIMLAVTGTLILLGWKLDQPMLFLPSLFTGSAVAFSPLSWRRDG